MDDPRAEPQYGERVPYVVKAGAPGARLIDRVVSPEEVLRDRYSSVNVIANRTRNMRLDADYYISKTLIPPLERIFNLVGANVRSWFEDMPKPQGRSQKELFNIRDLSRSNTATLHSFMRSRLCAVCKAEDTDEGINYSLDIIDQSDLCYSCRTNPAESTYVLSGRSHISESRHLQLQAICSDCCGVPFGEEICCDSRDCPVFYSRLKAASRLEDSVTRDSELLAAICESSRPSLGGGLLS